MATKGPEHYVKAIIKDQLKSLGLDCWYFMPEQGGFGRAGVPDFVGCYRGMFFAIEAKADGGRVSPHQKREIAGIDTAGGTVWVVMGKEQAADVAATLLREYGVAD